MGLYEKLNSMNIFFDLDGTLIDSRSRLYELFQHLIPQSKFTFDEYWTLKRNKITHEMILKKYFHFQISDLQLFEKKWMQLIETDEWIRRDQPFEGVTYFLMKLKENNFSLYLTTARQHKITAIRQLESFGWKYIFNHVLVTEQKTEKINLIKPFISADIHDWMIGDTGNDIVTGKLLGLRTVAVLSGFQSEEILTAYQPDLIIHNVTDLWPHINLSSI